MSPILHWPTDKAVRALRGRTCPGCAGDGWATVICPDCAGHGWVTAADPILEDTIDHRCPTCHHDGR